MTSKPVLIVVDDEPAIGEVISFVADRAGVEILIATSGTEFQKLVLERRPDVIFMDLVMPETSASDLVAWMAANDIKAPVILMSGYDESAVNALKKSAEKDGVPISGLLKKPFSLRDAEEKLMSALNRL